MSESLPDNVPEVGSLHISIGLEESQVGMGYNIDGLSDAEVIGHMEVLKEVLKQRQAQRFLDQYDDDDFDGEGFLVKAFHVTCPECMEDLTFEPEELFDGAEFFTDDEDDE